LILNENPHFAKGSYWLKKYAEKDKYDKRIVLFCICGFWAKLFSEGEASEKIR